MAQPEVQLEAQRCVVVPVPHRSIRFQYFADVNFRLVGSLFIAGFDGTQLTSNICRLIEEHYVGAILITPKNLISKFYVSGKYCDII